MYKKLKEICIYVRDRVEVASLNEDNYISTENMQPLKMGVVKATSLPSATTTSQYAKDDTLVSNIRPYFQKIWFATNDGGCSNDVLVFRALTGAHAKFLYYILSNKDFFDYVTAGAKGTKMPRGDKSSIMNYLVPDFTHDKQKRIASILSSLDDKIELNNRINDNLAS